MADSTHTTGNEPVEGIDPGGTHPTRPGKASGNSRTMEQHVESGDQNVHPDRNTQKD